MDHDYGAGWYIKVPYTANGLHYHNRSYNNLAEIIKEVNSAIGKNLKEIFPYLLLQPTIPNKKEYKVIMFDGIPQYFHQRNASLYYSPRHGSDAAVEVMNFAKDVYHALYSRTTNIILSGLIRMDIMRVKTDLESRLVINEVEGIDSAYYAKDYEKEISAKVFIRKHWYRIIEDKLNALM